MRSTRVVIEFPQLNDDEAYRVTSGIAEDLRNLYDVQQVMTPKVGEDSLPVIRIHLDDPALADMDGMTYEVRLGTRSGRPIVTMTHMGGKSHGRPL